MSRWRGAGKRKDGQDGAGLLAQLRHPPGGRDARIMLLAQLLDRTGTGVWGASCVLFFTFVTGLDGRQLGLLLGAAGVAGIAGSPLAGHLGDRFPVRTLLIGCHLLRLGTIGALLVFTRFEVLVLVVAVTSLGDRAAKMLEMLFATRTAGSSAVRTRRCRGAWRTPATPSVRASPPSASPSAPAGRTRS